MRDVRPRGPIVLVSSSAPDGFRIHLANALRDLGEDVVYLHLKRRPTFYLDRDDPGSDTDLPGAVARLGTICGGRRDSVFINSCTVSFPIFCSLLQGIFGGVWIYDLYDDFIYGRRGLTLARARAARWLQDKLAHATVRSAPMLEEVFPASLDLPFASHVTRKPRPEPDFSRVLVFSSFDRRTDVDFLRETARLSPQRQFHLYGVLLFDPHEVPAFERSLAAQPNIVHLGPYRDFSLDELLGRYDVTFAPYVQDSPFTRNIDPIRYRHAVNAGMEVVTTDLPSARALAEPLHIVRTPAEAVAAFDAIEREPRARKVIGQNAPTYEWSGAARRFLEIVDDISSSRSSRLPPLRATP